MDGFARQYEKRESKKYGEVFLRELRETLDAYHLKTLSIMEAFETRHWQTARWQPAVWKRYGISLRFVAERLLAVVLVAGALIGRWQVFGFSVPTYADFEQTQLHRNAWSKEPKIGIEQPVDGNTSQTDPPGDSPMPPPAPSPPLVPSPELTLEYQAAGPEQGKVRVVAEGPGELYWTTNGTLPAVIDGQPRGATTPYDPDWLFEQAAVARVVSVVDNKPSPIRSILVAPNRWTLTLDELPWEAAGGSEIHAVYITGPFHAWKTNPADCTRLKPRPEGGYAAELKIDGTTWVDYKFLLRRKDGSFDWRCHPGLPKQGEETHANNVVYPWWRVADCAVAKADGMLDEAFLDWDLVDVDDTRRRVVLRTLTGDVQQVWVASPDMGCELLRQTRYQQDDLQWTAHVGLLHAMSSHSDITFNFVVADAGQYWIVGPKGARPSGEFDPQARSG